MEKPEKELTSDLKRVQVKLLLQKTECEDAILCLMKDSRGGNYWFVRGVIENLIDKIDNRIEAMNKELS